MCPERWWEVAAALLALSFLELVSQSLAALPSHRVNVGVAKALPASSPPSSPPPYFPNTLCAPSQHPLCLLGTLCTFPAAAVVSQHPLCTFPAASAPSWRPRHILKLCPSAAGTSFSSRTGQPRPCGCQVTTWPTCAVEEGGEWMRPRLRPETESALVASAFSPLFLLLGLCFATSARCFFPSSLGF